MTPHRLIPLAAFAAMLAACGDDGAPQEGRVSGEVLEGTISDEMVPLDQVRSEAPLAEPAAAAGSGEPARGDGDSASAGPVETEAPGDESEAPADEAE